MSFRTSLKNLIRRDPTASLRERAAELRGNLTGQTRRTIVAGSVAASVPLPALTAPAALPAPHPDHALLDLDAAQVAAQAELDTAQAAYQVASDAVGLVLSACPAELRALVGEYRTFTHPLTWSSHRWGQIRFRYIPRKRANPDVEHWETQAWTGLALRRAISRAPVVLGHGGRTPFLIRRWKALLPIADAFDAQVEAAEQATGYYRLRAEQEAAIEAHRGLRAAIEKKRRHDPRGDSGARARDQTDALEGCLGCVAKPAPQRRQRRRDRPSQP